MRAVQVLTTTGPNDIVVTDVADPTPGPDDVLVEVHRVGISFPDLLLSKGQYQLKPDPPFTLGVDYAGVVVSGPGFEPGQRVAGVGSYGGAAELVPGERRAHRADDRPGQWRSREWSRTRLSVSRSCSSGKDSARSNLSWRPNTLSVPVPVRSDFEVPLARTSRSRSSYGVGTGIVTTISLGPVEVCALNQSS